MKHQDESNLSSLSKSLNHKEKLLQEYSNWLRMRNYSEQTYKAYMGTIRMFWFFCKKRQNDPTFDKRNAVQSYLSYRLHELNRDYSTVNGDYSALQWFYKYVLNRCWNVRKLIRPKKEKRLPRYISPEQVGDLLRATTSKKHRLLMLLYYGTGIRLSEGRELKWEFVKFDEGIIFITNGKGSKDRLVIMPENLSEYLEAYRRTQRRTQVYLFEGKTMGKPIASKTVQWGFKRAREKAGLPDWVTAHVLRHSYATTSLKNGADLLSLKMLLGHKKLSTTSRYMHLNVSHYKNNYNPLSDPCLSQHLEVPAHPDPRKGIQKEDLQSDKSSDSMEMNISKPTNRTIGNERS